MCAAVDFVMDSWDSWCVVVECDMNGIAVAEYLQDWLIWMRACCGKLVLVEFWLGVPWQTSKC